MTFALAFAFGVAMSFAMDWLVGATKAGWIWCGFATTFFVLTGSWLLLAVALVQGYMCAHSYSAR